MKIAGGFLVLVWLPPLVVVLVGAARANWRKSARKKA
jgi:hypothetical protein